MEYYSKLKGMRLRLSLFTLAFFLIYVIVYAYLSFEKRSALNPFMFIPGKVRCARKYKND